MPQSRFKIAIAAIFLLVFPVEAFYVATRQQAFPLTSSLLLQEDGQGGENSESKNDEETSTPKLRRYQGGMMKPVVVAATPEPTENFVKLNGYDAKLNQKDTTDYSGMFRPNAVKIEDDETANDLVSLPVDESEPATMYEPHDPVSVPVDESEPATTYITGGLIGAAEESSAVEEDETKAETDDEPIFIENLEEQNVQDANEFAESKEIDQTLKGSEETTAANTIETTDEEAQRKDPEPEPISEADQKIEEEPQEIQSETTDTQVTVGKKDVEEIEPIINESKTESDSETEGKPNTVHVDTSALEQVEAEKLKAIEAKIQIRKQQKAVLDKIEDDLLKKADDIKRRKEELARLEDEFARAESAIGNDGDGNEEIPEKETNVEIPWYSPREYSALPLEEKMKLREARAAIKKTDNSSSIGESSDSPAHPLLGPVIVDLGYKRVHVVSSGRLGTIPIWKKQRTFKYDRVKSMAAEKEEQMHLGFPGIICLNEDAEGKLSIIDGQHRVGMMQALRQSRKKFKQGELGEKTDSEQEKIWNEQEEYFQNILVEVYSESSTGKATETTEKDSDYTTQVFQEINKAEPIRFE